MKSAVLIPVVKRLAGMGHENETLPAAEKPQGGYMQGWVPVMDCPSALIALSMAVSFNRMPVIG